MDPSSIQANFFNSLKCNRNKQAIDSTNSSENSILEEEVYLEEKLVSDEVEKEEYSPLQESIYNNFIPNLLGIKKNLKFNTKNKFSIDHYKKTNAIIEYKLKNEFKQMEISFQTKSCEKNDLIAEICKIQEILLDTKYFVSKAKDDLIKEPVQEKPSFNKGKHSSIFNIDLNKGNTITDSEKNFDNFIDHQKVLRNLQFTYEKSILIENLNKQKSEKKTSIEKLDVDLKNLKSNLKLIKSKLLRHYFTLLKVGLDTRKEGLTWVIKELCLLKAIVKLTDMPEFLDQEATLYLFNVTKLNMDIDKIIEEKHKMKSEVQIKKNSGVIRINPMIKLFNTSLIKDLDCMKTLNTQNLQSHISNSSAIYSYSDRSSISQNFPLIKKKIQNNSIAVKLDLNFRHVSQFFDKKVKLTDDLQKIIQCISNLDKKELDLRQEMKKLKENELSRIFLEFVKNNYERRFYCDKKQVLAALIGEESAAIELVRQFSYQKAYYKELEMCRNFLPYSNKSTI